jgi:hypothetical protein
VTTLTQWELVAETKEWVGPITLTVNGGAVTNFTLAVCEGTARPTTFTTPDVDPDPPNTDRGVIVGVGSLWPLTLGKTYTIFAKYSDSPEIPVVRVGRIKVT